MSYLKSTKTVPIPLRAGWYHSKIAQKYNDDDQVAKLTLAIINGWAKSEYIEIRKVKGVHTRIFNHPNRIESIINFSLPGRFITPNKWEYVEGENAWRGGYYSAHASYKLLSGNRKAIVSSKYVELANKYQSQAWKFNESVLRTPDDIDFTTRSERVMDAATNIDPDKEWIKLRTIIDEVESKYHNDRIRWVKLLIARKLYKVNNHKIYFPVSVDYRGRRYSKGSLAPTNSKDLRHAISIQSQMTPVDNKGMTYLRAQRGYALGKLRGITPKTIDDAAMLEPTQKESNTYIISALNLRITKDEHALLQRDATASRLQILACLRHDTKLARSCNVYSHHEPLDPYIIFLEDIRNADLETISALRVREGSGSAYISNPTKVKKQLEAALPHLGRSLLKTCIRRYIYGSNLKTIADEVLGPEILSTWPNQVNKYVVTNFILLRCNNHGLKRGLDAIHRSVADSLTVSGSYPIRGEWIKSSVIKPTTRKRQRTILKTVNGEEKSIISQYTQILKKKRSKMNGKRKTLNTIKPNSIHAIDAEIRLEVVQEFLSLNKPILSIHDCWRVHPNDGDLLVSTYNRHLSRVCDKWRLVFGMDKKFPNEEWETRRVLESKFSLKP